MTLSQISQIINFQRKKVLFWLTALRIQSIKTGSIAFRPVVRLHSMMRAQDRAKHHSSGNKKKSEDRA